MLSQTVSREDRNTERYNTILSILTSSPVARQNISRLFALAAGSVEAIPAWSFVPYQRVTDAFTYVQMNRAKESSSGPSVKAPCISNGAKWKHHPEKRNRCVKIAGD